MGLCRSWKICKEFYKAVRGVETALGTRVRGLGGGALGLILEGAGDLVSRL